MKTKHLLVLLPFAAIMVGGLSSCNFRCIHGSGHQISENRTLGNFSSIDISGGFKVILKQDSASSLKITGDDNLLKYIKSSVDGGRLRIYTKRSLCNSGEMTIYLSVRNIEEVKASGAVEIASDGKIAAQDIRFKLTGATKINMTLNANHVTTSGSGATEINLKGQASSYDVDLSGSGKIYALDFVVGSCNIQTSGVGHSEVNVLNSLSVHSSGASEVKYRGNPTISNDKAGASSIEKVN